ncbi:hypothetical protein C8T65DRAFT_727049, partial [Cerioporus squamosus]
MDPLLTAALAWARASIAALPWASKSSSLVEENFLWSKEVERLQVVRKIVVALGVELDHHLLSLHTARVPMSKQTLAGRNFVNYGHAEAAGQKVSLPERRKATKVHVEKLCVTEEQKQAIAAIYAQERDISLSYNSAEKDERIAAAAKLAEVGIDLEGRVGLGNRWSVRWSQPLRPKQRTRRKLYQWYVVKLDMSAHKTRLSLCHGHVHLSDCGYNEKSRNTTTRRSPVDFTGCLAHAEVLYELATGHVLLIRGWLDHNQRCKDAFLTRIPPIPLHQSVYEVALKQLEAGAQLADIQEKNRQMFRDRKYPGQPVDLHDSPYRWLLRTSDTRSLYRQFNRLRGINTTSPAHINVHGWRDPSSPIYNKAFADAIFHYSPRAEKDDRFEVCIATDEMREAAWRYAHNSQILLDGTFGLCDRKLLLFIVMGLDEKNCGLPLAFLLFSAPSGNKQTSSGYNTEILTKLLSRWKAALGTRDGTTFSPCVATTDTDLKERGALLDVFPGIWLILCKFHVRQSWRNHRTRVVKGTTAYHVDVRRRLSELETALVETTGYEEAQALVKQEREILMREDLPESHGAITGGLEHLDYLSGYWMSSEDFWRSWSEFARQAAAKILGRKVEGVVRTTNHLEAFNGVLKRKHIRRWQRGGRRVRVDILLHLFVFSLVPAIYQARTLEQLEEARLAAQMKAIPGGAELLAANSTARGHPSQQDTSTDETRYAWLAPDESRDSAAAGLVENRQISVPDFQEQSRTFAFDCFSSRALASDTAPVSYSLSIGLDGSAACSCADFRARGGACKHIRAGLLMLDELRKELQKKNLSVPSISLPKTAKEARTLFASRTPDAMAVFKRPTAAVDASLPGAGVVMRAAQLVDDVLQASGDMFETHTDAAFVTAEDDIDIPGLDDDDMSESAPESCMEDLEQQDELEVPSLPPLTSDSDVETVLEDDTVDTSQSRLALGGSARAGVNQHRIARVFHELEADGPRLRQLGELLAEAELPESELIRAQRLKADIDVLSTQLGRLIVEAKGQDKRQPETSPSAAMLAVGIEARQRLAIPAPAVFARPREQAARRTPSPDVQRKSKRRKADAHLVIFPASPENAQKRQQSKSNHL